MLHLHDAWLGCTPSVLHHLLLPHISLLLYPSADAVVILDALSLQLIRILPFFDAFPVMLHTNERVSCVSVDPAMKLIVASMGHRIAAWSLSGANNDSWRIHSTISLPPDHIVSALDNKSGLLAVGTTHGLAVYTLILENDLPTWSQKWSTKVTSPFLARFSPSLMLMAAASKKDNIVRLYSITTGRQTQTLRHPKSVTNLSWRFSEASSRDDLILYTTTSDATLRIFLPVLDAPTSLQLHASLDLFSSTPLTDFSALSGPSKIFELSRDVISTALKSQCSSLDMDNAWSRRLRDINDETWDLFVRTLVDGTLIVTAVANIDRRPPTLLRQFTFQQTPLQTLPRLPSHLRLVPQNKPTSNGDSALQLHLLTTPPLSSFSLSLPQFFDTDPQSGSGLTLIASQRDTPLQNSLSLEEQDEEQQRIIKFIRTPDGQGVVVLRTGGCGGIWKVANDTSNPSRLKRGTKWRSNAVRFAVALDGGGSFATYDTAGVLTLHASIHLPSLSLESLPTTTPECTLQIPELASLFSMPAKGGSGEDIIGITPDYTVYHIQVKLRLSGEEHSNPSLSIRSRSTLPSTQVKHILPVDPMAWSRHPWEEHDVLLSISEDGELAFWGFDDIKHKKPLANGGFPAKSNPWRSTGCVRTGKAGITKARCSSAKKSALVVASTDSDELTIWDSKESEFASGLEYRQIYREKINDLDWTSTPDAQSILAVGFLHRVELLCQQRMTYFDDGQGWATCHIIDLANQIPYSISDSIWLANGSLLIGTGHQMYLFGQSKVEHGKTIHSSGLFEFVARQNSPLEDYHPQMVLQCLLWEKVELVKEIILNLSKYVLARESSSAEEEATWPLLPVERFFSRDDLSSATRQKNGAKKTQYSSLFDGPQTNSYEEEQDIFSRALVTKLISALEASPLQHLTENENAHLLVLIQTSLEIEEQRRALDANGLRYLISMRSFYILNRRATTQNRYPPSVNSQSTIPPKKGHRERLRYRDMVWAFHSESQELLMSTSTAACNGGKMVWSDARALGVPLWLTSVDSLRLHFEVIARNEYMAGENRDPTACSLFYFALKKWKLVHGLWRQAAWHKEQGQMLKFLSKDFTEPRSQTVALKNAFALMSKQRFEYAAAFFLLGGSLKDAVNVCIKQLSDWQLAIALARVVEQSNDGPIYQDILKHTVLPTAIKDGNRWLGSWVFWQMHRRDLAVRILVTPLQDIAAGAELSHVRIGEPHYDDPSLALLFSQLKSKTLQAVKGTSEISGRMEFKFVLQIARVFRRMGCHVLALDLVRSWSFERPSFEQYAPTSLTQASPIAPRRHSQFGHLRRRSSILIDMDITSEASTERSPLGEPSSTISTIPEEITIKDEQDLVARKAGLGSLMKSAQQDVSVAEFDMNSFGF